jgi:gamma-glutamyltranspeptidase / glutathione hydrolase / leukotriene-C4 hydrolase
LETQKALEDFLGLSQLTGGFEDGENNPIWSLSLNFLFVLIMSNFSLGSMVMSESSGILWNDQMDDFSSPGHPNYYGYPPTPSNYIRPGKRPMSSTSPIIVYDNKTGVMLFSKFNIKIFVLKEVTALGGAGGSTIISGVSFVAMKALWMKKDVKYAIDFPRLHNQLKPNVTTYEKRWPKVLKFCIYMDPHPNFFHQKCQKFSKFSTNM